jgi:hypothetical protein
MSSCKPNFTYIGLDVFVHTMPMFLFLKPPHELVLFLFPEVGAGRGVGHLIPLRFPYRLSFGDAKAASDCLSYSHHRPSWVLWWLDLREINRRSSTSTSRILMRELTDLELSSVFIESHRVSKKVDGVCGGFAEGKFAWDESNRSDAIPYSHKVDFDIGAEGLFEIGGHGPPCFAVVFVEVVCEVYLGCVAGREESNFVEHAWEVLEMKGRRV